MEIHGISQNFMVSTENHDILCFQPSADRHETLIFLRKKQGLSSLALQGAHKTEIVVKFQQFHQIPRCFIKFHKNQKCQENHVLGCQGANMTAATIEKA